MLPVKSILREYLTMDESGGETDAEGDEEEDTNEVEAMAETRAVSEPEPESEVKTKVEPEPKTEPEQEPDLTGPTGASEQIPIINLNDVPSSEDSSTGLFESLNKEAVQTPPARPTTPVPPIGSANARPSTPTQANVIKESAPSLLEELEEIADLPIFEDEVEAKMKDTPDENDFEFEELA
jgi:hypothetical protein